MGHPVEPYDTEYEEGDECPECNDVIFHGRTPKHMKALFSGIESCGPAPPTGVIPPIWLFQDDQSPCGWQGWSRDDRWFADYSCNRFGKFSVLQLFGPGGDIFSGWIEQLCQTSFENDYLCTKGDDYEGGSGSVRWGLKVDEEFFEIW